MMTRSDDNDAVLEILDAGPGAGWHVAPGSRAEYPLCIRNGTEEWHDVEVRIMDPIDWVSVKPARLSLPPGAETHTTVIFTVPQNTSVMAGDHRIKLELHDFEGTSFGQVVSLINVLPAYHLEMSLSLRGPLRRRDIVDGIVMRCRLVNRGNGECSVALHADQYSHLSLQTSLVRVPPGAEVVFDIEARWTSDVLSSYPSEVTVFGEYQGGEVCASIGWSEIARCLGTALPPNAPLEEYPAILTRSGSSAMSESSAITQPPLANRVVERATRSGPASMLRVQINGPVTASSTRGRRLNPWWPPVERFAGRLVVKLRVALVLLVVLTALVASLSSLRPQTAGPAPLQSLATLTGAGSHPSNHRVPSIAALHHLAATTGSRVNKSQIVSLLAVVPLPLSPRRAMATPTGARHKAHQRPISPHWDVWHGWITHVSAGNVKVYDPSQKAWRSFVLLPGFKDVYLGGSYRQVPLSRLRNGSVVRLFYSYSLGIRRAREIDLLP